MKITPTAVAEFVQHFVNINSGFSFPDHTFRYVMCSAKRYSEGRMLKRNCFYMIQLSMTPTRLVSYEDGNRSSSRIFVLSLKR